MSDQLNRFALSALSRKNKAYAVPHEIMIHKEIGQISIKTPAGDIISTDSLTRVQNHIENVSNRAKLANIWGDLYLLNLNFEMPEVIDENVNLMDSPLLIKSAPFSGVMISIDLDSVLLSTDNDNIVESEPYVDLAVNFKRTLGNGSIEDNRYVISKKLNTINTMRIEPRNFLPTTVTDYSPYSMHLESIIVRRDSAIYHVETGIKNIIHSIVVVCE
jgi:hypothetical protein